MGKSITKAQEQEIESMRLAAMDLMNGLDNIHGNICKILETQDHDGWVVDYIYNFNINLPDVLRNLGISVN